MRGFRLVATVLGAALALGQAASGEDFGFRVIVNAANPVASINRSQLSGLFLKQETSWPDGQVALPVDLGESSPVRADFSRVVLRRPVAAVKSYWNKQIFSGGGVPPIEKSSGEDVVSYVSAFHGAVGYVGLGVSLPAGVKAVKLTD